MLDFQGAGSLPPSFSLTALLSGQVDSGAIQDKIVLIGVTAESVPDLFHTPYSSGFQSGRMIPGVALHAQIVSQLLGAGLDKRSLILTASETQETLWILLWGVLGGVLGLWARSPWRFYLRGGMKLRGSSATNLQPREGRDEAWHARACRWPCVD